MELSNIQYFNDQVEDDLKIFFRDGMIGLQNMKSGKQTIPCFEHVVTSPKYIFVEIDGSWGLLDKDLCFIIPPKYHAIYPVKEIEREDYISMCMDKSKDYSGVFNADCDCPTHVAIQNASITHYGRVRRLLPELDDIFDESDNLREEYKATIYEIDYEYEHISTATFVMASKDSSCFIDLSRNNILIEKSKEFHFLWHYKENSFIFRNNDSSFGFSSYWEGRFHKEILIHPKQGDGIITDSPKIIFHRNDFVSVCLPDINKHIGNTTYKDEKLSICGKWALFRFGHRKRGLNYWKENVESYFQQLTPFAFTEPLSQTHDGFTFICREMGKEWLVRYAPDKESLGSTPHITDEDSEKAATLVDEYMHSTYKPALLESFVEICFKGGMVIVSSFFDSIECREDGMYDISTDEGYGLCDENMQIIIPPRYDNIIGDLKPLMIVSKDDRYGVINSKAEEIVPCSYEYIKLGNGEIPIWERECEWNELLDQSESKWFISTRNDIKSSDVDLMKEGYFVIGIIPGFPKIEKAGNNTILDNLKALVTKTNSNVIPTTPCDIYLPNGKLVANCRVSKQGGFEFDKETGTLMVFDAFSSNKLKRYGIYVETSSCPVCISSERSRDIYSLNGNLYEGYYNLEKILITKYICEVKWNGLGRCNFKTFEVSQDNKVFQTIEGVLYTRKGYDRCGKTDKRNMMELVACPTNVKTHNVISGTTRISNCAFKGTNIEKLSLPDSLEEIGVNAFYLANQIKELEIPLSIRKIESQDVGKSGATSPTIKYDGHVFLNWEDLYVYMCEHGFERRYGNIIVNKKVGTSESHGMSISQEIEPKDNEYIRKCGMTKEKYLKENYNEVNTLTAVCKKNVYDFYTHEDYPELEVGKSYQVTHIGVFRSFSKIMLNGFGNKEYRAACFEIFENGESIDKKYTQDQRFWAPYLREIK